MLTPVVFLPLAAVLINDVKAESSDGAVTVDIATSDPVSTSDVRVASGGPRRLYVYLDGSAARHTTFGESPGAIIVHPRLRYTKLEVPTTSRCGQPIGVTATAAGVRVRATCRDGAALAGTGVPPVQVQAGANAGRPQPETPRGVLVQDRQASASLRAALALPAEATDDARGAEAGAREEPARSKVAGGPEAAEAEHAQAAPAAHGAARAEVQVVAAPPSKAGTAEAPVAASQASTSATRSGSEQTSLAGSVGTALAVVLLLGMGVAIVVRRRTTRERMIRIVETASIGARRSLVIASVGGRTMVLGVSEAGVSLLDSQMPRTPLDSVLDPKPNGPVEDAALGLRNLAFAAGFAQDSKPEEPKNEGSLLGRLFHRRRAPEEGLEPEDFDQLFSESLEDEDLRRKLSMGQSGRVA
jgi:flagellar biogenesis protein FliO